MDANAAPRTLLPATPPLNGCYDEIVDGDGQFRRDCGGSRACSTRLGPREMERRQQLADGALRQGVTFSVYSDSRGAEKIFPFCLMPRAGHRRATGRSSSAASMQRVRALDLFLDDIYGEQKILAREAGACASWCSSTGLPAEAARHQAAGRRLHPHRRHRSGPRPRRRLRVLEDNLRTPSGVSYVIENRLVMKRVVPARVRSRRRPPRRSLPGAAAPRRCARVAGGDGDARDRGAHAGAVQLGVLRAQLPGAHDGRRAGRRAATSSSTATSVFVRTTRGPRRGRRHLSPHRRGVPRSRGVPPRQHARRRPV